MSGRPLLLSPWRVIIAVLVVMAFVGAFLLSIPAAQKVPHAFIDLFFTSASAVSVTGILTVSLDSFTLFGKAIILFLIQIGGIGFLTLAIPLISVFFDVGMQTHLITGHQFELENWSNSWTNTRRVIGFILILTLIIEAIGALGFYWMLNPSPSGDPRWFTALFFGISSFCNSGVAPFPDGDMSTVAGNMPLIGLSTVLMVIGSFGFIPLYEIARRIKWWWLGESRPSLHFTLHSKIIICFAPLMTLIFVPLLWYFERVQFWGHSFFETINLVLFNTVSLRSCGFTTLDPMLFMPVTIMLIIVFAFIGSSPGSVGGGTGIRITAFVLTLASIRAAIRGREDVELFGRRIPYKQIIRTFAVVAASIMWCILSTILLLVVSTPDVYAEFPIHIYLFEAVSAFANHGVSLGLAAKLSVTGKFIMAASMIIGRISALTIILAICKYKEKNDFQYPEENVLLV
ncbi:MAG: hypothetical protein JW725_04175 [Candidatus Babeliaceae bacterium]|nr:hypothetical protein [Candidatus Babeliaceae bacterium]